MLLNQFLQKQKKVFASKDVFFVAKAIHDGLFLCGESQLYKDVFGSKTKCS
jgi:hypothetical protein